MRTKRDPKIKTSGPRRPRRFRGALLVFAVLLVVPVLALVKLARVLDPYVVCGYVVLISGAAFWCYGHDKRQAENAGWRVPEATLHLLAFCGGWPGAFLAQRAFRHKTRKLPFQFVYWSTVIVHQYVALESLWGWQIAAKVRTWLTG